MARWLRRGLGALLALALVAGGALHLRDRRLGGRLVDDVHRLSAARSRPVQRASSRESTFQACLGPLLDSEPAGAQELARRSSALGAELLAIREGTRPVSAMSRALAEQLDQVLPWADAVRGCTEAPEVGSAPGLGPFADWNHPRQRGGGLSITSVVSIAMLQARRDVSSASADAALLRCSDSLALARDLVFDRGLVGSALAVAATRMTLKTCAAELCTARPEARATFTRELGQIRRALPSYSEVLRVERAEMQLVLFGQFLASGDARRLPEEALALSAQGRTQGHAVARYLYWPGYLGKLDRLIEAADTPHRDAVFEAELRSPSFLERLVDNEGTQPATLLDLAHRYELVGRGLDLLEAVASSPTTALPATVSRREGDDAGVILSVSWMPPEPIEVSECSQVPTAGSSPGR